MDLMHSTAALLDFTPTTEAFLGDVRRGLAARPRHLPCKYFYDERGSRLFEEICGLQEYYPTRKELAIIRRYAGKMAEEIGPRVMLVDYGSGTGVKTRILLDHLEDPVAYVPVDISRDHLMWTADRISLAYPALEVLPVCADFAQAFRLPTPTEEPTHTTVFFPGSTIGNFQPQAAQAMLAQIAEICGTGGELLIGVDLQKDTATLEAAYNDRKGVTAQFNLNLLRRINRELGADFDLSQFEHRAIYNDQLGRIEVYLVSRCRQDVRIAEESIRFEAGEPICTEYSYKYAVDGFAAMAAEANLLLRHVWTDDDRFFAVLHLTAGG